MRVLVNALGARMGGALAHLRGLMDELDTRSSGHEWTFLVDASIGDQLPHRSVRVETMPTRGAGARALTDQIVLPWMARRTRADVLVSLLNHGPRFATVPHVVFQRNAWYFDANVGAGTGASVRKALAVAACRGAAAVVTPTRAMADLVGHALGPRPPVVVIPHGVDTRFFTSDAFHLDDLPAPGLAGAGRPRLVYVAHASQHKGHEELMAAFRTVAQSFPEAALALTIGADEPPEGGDRGRAAGLMAEAADLPGVHFVGRCSRLGVRALYEWADIAVFPSRLESFGFPVVEAMAMGLPLVCSDLPVLRELAGDAALYHRIGDAEAMAAQIMRLAGEASLRDAGARQRSARAESFSMPRSVTRIEALLEAVAGRQPIASTGAWS